MSIASHSLSLSSITRCSIEGKQERSNMSLIFDRYKDRLVTLPKERGWITENLYMYQGFWQQSLRRVSVETVMALQDTFEAHPSDIYLVTLPKSGTTWLKGLVFALVNRNRNPKDVLVSMFHFANKLRDKSRGLMTFQETFDLFSKGIMPTGLFWDHVRGYHKISLEHLRRVLFLTYEDMKLNTVNSVKRLAKSPFTEEEEAEGAVQEIVKLCSFESLSEVNKYGNLHEGVPNDAFFREGKVGDRTNHLINEMSQFLYQITKD